MVWQFRLYVERLLAYPGGWVERRPGPTCDRNNLLLSGRWGFPAQIGIMIQSKVTLPELGLIAGTARGLGRGSRSLFCRTGSTTSNAALALSFFSKGEREECLALWKEVAAVLKPGSRLD
jgi:hypothetical protein